MFTGPLLCSLDHVPCSLDRIFSSVKMAEEVYTFTVLSVNTTEEKARKDVALAEKQINFASNTDASTQGIYHLFYCLCACIHVCALNCVHVCYQSASLSHHMSPLHSTLSQGAPLASFPSSLFPSSSQK